METHAEASSCPNSNAVYGYVPAVIFPKNRAMADNQAVAFIDVKLHKEYLFFAFFPTV